MNKVVLTYLLLMQGLTANADTQLQESLTEARPHSYEVFTPCSTSSTFKSYMDYRAITNTSSQQYKLQQTALTKNGYRIFENRIMIAIAGFSVGDKLDLYLESGEVLETVVGDIKANTSCEHPDGSIVEFIVDTTTMPSRVKLLGNYNSIHVGSVLKIHKIQEGVDYSGTLKKGYKITTSYFSRT